MKKMMMKKRKAMYEILYGTCYDLYGYMFGGLEYIFLCIILVWNKSLRYGYLMKWLWSSMEENFYRKNVGF